MTLRLVSREEIARAFGCARDHIDRRSSAESWPYVVGMVRGGRQHLYNIKDLPGDVRGMLFRSYRSEPKAKAYGIATESARATADYRMSVMTAWLTFECDVTHAEARRVAFCNQWNTEHPESESVSTRTLRRWEQSLHDSGIDGLLPAYGNSRRETAIPEDVAATFRALYLDESKLTVRCCVALTQKAFRNTDREEDFPSVDAFYRLVKTFDAEEVVRYRDGKDAWRNKCAPYIIRDDSEMRPNDVWVGDHRRFDVLVRGTSGRMIRPWVTAWFDWSSRALVGWHIFEGEPCSDTILLAFRRGVEGYGVPHQLYVDNGKDYRSKAITGGRAALEEEGRYHSLAAQLGMKVQFATPYNARAKVVERFFLTLKNGFDRLYKSFTGGTTTEKPERLADIKLEDCPTMADFRAAFTGWVADYHATAHGSLGGRTPAQAFVERLETRRTAPADMLRLCLLKTTQPRVLRRNGVEVLGTWYDSPQLNGLFGRKVFVRYDPEKMGSVEVYDDKDRFVCTATNRIALTHGADHEDLKAAIREQRQRRKDVEAGKRAAEALALRVDPLEMLMGMVPEKPVPPETPVVTLIQRQRPKRDEVRTETVDPLEREAFLSRVCDLHERRPGL